MSPRINEGEEIVAIWKEGSRITPNMFKTLLPLWFKSFGKPFRPRIEVDENNSIFVLCDHGDDYKLIRKYHGKYY
jgi:hypothetical protein